MIVIADLSARLDVQCAGARVADVETPLLVHFEPVPVTVTVPVEPEL